MCFAILFQFVYCVQSYILKSVNAFCKVIGCKHIKGRSSVVLQSCVFLILFQLSFV